VLRLLHSQGVALSSLGVSNATGPQESGVSPRQVWRTFAEHQHLFRGTPSSLWLRESLAAAFNVTEKLSGGNAERLYDTIDAALKRDSSRPSVLLDTFNIRLLATTNGATDELAAHAALSRGALRGRVVPTFRPDDVTDVLAPHWLSNLAKLRELTGERIDTFPSFLSALRIRRRAFIALGATASDHGATRPTTLALPAQRAQELFSSALAGGISASEASEFSAHMLVESARMSAQDGLVMQLHAGVVRNHDPQLFARYGADKGGDVPHAVGWTEGLQPLLSELGWHPNLTLVLFTLDESTYSRELAPLAGHYPILRLGPPWWFHDSLNGMRRYLDAVVETAGVANLAGFNDDTRAFLSIPARHTLWRRAVADWAAEQHARGVMDWPDARAVVYDLAYGNAKKTYKLAGQAL
jgi:glucuronate isomerase